MDNRLMSLGVTGLLLVGCVDDVEHVEVEDNETGQSWEIDERISDTSDDIDCILKVDESNSLFFDGDDQFNIGDSADLSIWPVIRFEQIGDFGCHSKRTYTEINSENNIKIIGANCFVWYADTGFEDGDDFEPIFTDNYVECLSNHINDAVDPAQIILDTSNVTGLSKIKITVGWEMEDVGGYRCRFQSPNGEFSTSYEITQTITLIR